MALLLGVALTLPGVNVCPLVPRPREGAVGPVPCAARFLQRAVALMPRGLSCLLLLSAHVAGIFAFLLWFGLARVGALVRVAPG